MQKADQYHRIGTQSSTPSSPVCNDVPTHSQEVDSVTTAHPVHGVPGVMILGIGRACARFVRQTKVQSSLYHTIYLDDFISNLFSFMQRYRSSLVAREREGLCDGISPCFIHAAFLPFHYILVRQLTGKLACNHDTWSCLAGNPFFQKPKHTWDQACGGFEYKRCDVVFRSWCSAWFFKNLVSQADFAIF